MSEPHQRLQALQQAMARLLEAKQILQGAGIIAGPTGVSAAKQASPESVPPLLDMTIEQAEQVLQDLRRQLKSS